MVESSLVAYDGETISYSIGEVASVEFDFLKVWEYYKYAKTIDNFDLNKLVFYHVHPPSFRCFSTLDVDCMIGFGMAFKGDIPFSIILFNNESISDFQFEQIDYKYLHTDQVIIKTSNRPLSKDQIMILKLLSYPDLIKKLGHTNQKNGEW